MAERARALLRPLYHRAFRAHLRTRCWLADRFGHDDQTKGIPLPPALLRYRVSECLSSTDFLRVGKGCAWHIEQQVREANASLAGMSRVLDFGCGCGRTLRWMLERFPEAEFHGADVDAEAIEWCKRNLPGAAYVCSEPEPPLPFAQCYFDLVYCVSVFTHLDERMQDMWLTELRRVLKDSGVLILTVHGAAAARRLHDDETAMRLNDKGFAHQRSRKLSGIVPEWYNTSWHSRGYIEERLGRLFGEVRYVVVPDGSQDLVVARGVTPGS
jgi:SAM-dependent methyltransferase